MLIPYIIGLGTGILISFIIFMIIRNRNIKTKLNKISKITKYTNNISAEVSSLLALILSYLNEEKPSKLLKKEIKKVITREANKWGVRKNDTNNLWVDIRSNISSSTDNSDRKSKSND